MGDAFHAVDHANDGAFLVSRGAAEEALTMARMVAVEMKNCMMLDVGLLYGTVYFDASRC